MAEEKTMIVRTVPIQRSTFANMAVKTTAHINHCVKLGSQKALENNTRTGSCISWYRFLLFSSIN